MKEIAKVYEETDYSKFKRLEHNRSVLNNRVARLKASFQEKEIINPIVVNEKMEIIDGQGRYEALKQLGRPIRFVIEEGATIEDCQRMNKCNKPWTSSDFVYSYASAGNENYKRLIECNKRTGFTFRRCVALGGHTHMVAQYEGAGMKQSVLEKGTLVFTESDAEDVFTILVKGNEICQSLASANRLNDAFWNAVKVITNFDGYRHERMLANCEKQRHTYVQMARVGDQIAEFERIYNYNTKSNKQRLYFTDYMRNRGYNVRTYTNKKIEEDVSTLT